MLAVARSIASADGVYDADELRSLSQLFPQALLSAVGFLDDAGALTPAYDEARAQAMQDLPEHLPFPRKLELLAALHEVTLADGELHEAEFALLGQAAEHLQVGVPRLMAHLASISGDSEPPPVRTRPWEAG